MRWAVVTLSLMAFSARALAQTDAGDTDAGDTDASDTDTGDTNASDTDAGDTDGGGSDAGDPLDDPATSEEDTAAREALERGSQTDSVAVGAERTGEAEGTALGGSAPIATEIAALSDRSCLRALVRAAVSFTRVRSAVPGVATPVRVTGAIRGVTWHEHGRGPVDELMDCRLAVGLARFSAALRSVGVNEVQHLSLYRAPSAREVRRRPVQSRHPGAMAIDAAIFVRDSGERLVVERDFHGQRGRSVCGPTARVAALPAARFLRSLFCDSARRGFFHVVLGPNFNYQHRNHFHFEVARGVSWQFVR